MATVTVAPPLSISIWHQVVLHNVLWGTYRQLRDEEANNAVRMTYLDGDLILMSPELKHDHPVELLGLLVRGVAAGRGVTIMGIRTTTLRLSADPGQPRGAAKEADAAYYLAANERRMRLRGELDLDVDPPPDLAIEVENSRNLTPTALQVYARLGVPEVWKFRAASRAVTIHHLNAGSYAPANESRAFPALTTERIHEALSYFETGDLDENGWFEWVKQWARDLPAV